MGYFKQKYPGFKIEIKSTWTPNILNTTYLGIDDYDEFIKSCAEVYIKMYNILRVGAHIVIIIKNVKKDGKFYPLAWDLAKELSSFELKDEKIWIQDKIGLTYGYPFSWTSNILHHYCLILRK